MKCPNCNTEMVKSSDRRFNGRSKTWYDCKKCLTSARQETFNGKIIKTDWFKGE